MNQRETLLCAASFGCLGVIIGAFGAHAFKEALATTGRLDTFEIAVRYQFYHAIAMLGVGVLMSQITSKMMSYSSLFFCLGIVFFSGSLYALCVTGEKILGAITPIGGIFFILGWIFLILGVIKK
jgi:uncharacterized membrane protein YgdD (TMEM256/DUF423 family)